MHFENIWNEAESVAKSYDLLNKKEHIKNISTYLQDLSDDQLSENQMNIALGEILFSLCSLCSYHETSNKLELNSAVALIDAIQRKREEILDPEEKE